MDILAARKKAAEKAKEASDRNADQAFSSPDQQETDAPATAFSPLPRETTFMPNGPVAAQDGPVAVQEQAPEMPPVREMTAAAPMATAAPEPEKKEEPASGPLVSGKVEPEQQEEQDLEMLSFLLGNEDYVVPVDRVREVLTPKEITPVPHTADYLVGVCSLRGMVMPVVDLNRRLGLAASARDEKSRIIVVSLGQDDQVGLFVDRVRGVVRFLSSAVRPAPETVSQGAGAEFLKGIARKDDQLYILLDVEKAIGA
jgi:purine-binding chemotaxis protein CheW